MLSVLLWQGLTWDLFYSVFEFVGNEKREQTSVISLDLSRVYGPSCQKVKQNQLTSKTEGSFAWPSVRCIPICISEARNKKSTTIHSCSLGCIPFSLGSTTCSWCRFPLDLSWSAALCFLSPSAWQVFKHLENVRPLWAREGWAWHLQHGDEPLLCVGHCKGFI